MPLSDWISRVYPDLTSCEEKNNWRTLSGWLCSDYEQQKWCENGAIGSKWVNGWNFSVDINGLDARDVCPICGGNENSGKILEIIFGVKCLKGECAKSLIELQLQS